MDYCCYQGGNSPGLLYEGMMTFFTSSKKATSTDQGSKTLKICCFFYSRARKSDKSHVEDIQSKKTRRLYTILRSKRIHLREQKTEEQIDATIDEHHKFSDSVPIIENMLSTNDLNLLIVLERFNTSAGNSCQGGFSKLNLSDHRIDPHGSEVPWPSKALENGEGLPSWQSYSWGEIVEVREKVYPGFNQRWRVKGRGLPHSYTYWICMAVPPSEGLFKVALLDPSPILWFTWESLRTPGLTLCAIWKNLGYSEWSTLAGLKLARENLQSKVKEEDSITDIENAIFDLGVMDSLCFSFIDQRVFISMITEVIKLVVELFCDHPRFLISKFVCLKPVVLKSGNMVVYHLLWLGQGTRLLAEFLEKHTLRQPKIGVFTPFGTAFLSKMGKPIRERGGKNHGKQRNHPEGLPWFFSIHIVKIVPITLWQVPGALHNTQAGMRRLGKCPVKGAAVGKVVFLDQVGQSGIENIPGDGEERIHPKSSHSDSFPAYLSRASDTIYGNGGKGLYELHQFWHFPPSEFIGESFSITNFEGHGLVIMSKGHLFIVNVYKGPWPSARKKGLPRLGWSPRGSATTNQRPHIWQKKKDVPTFTGKILGDAGVGSRNRWVASSRIISGFGSQSWAGLKFFQNEKRGSKVDSLAPRSRRNRPRRLCIHSIFRKSIRLSKHWCKFEACVGEKHPRKLRLEMEIPKQISIKFEARKILSKSDLDTPGAGGILWNRGSLEENQEVEFDSQPSEVGAQQHRIRKNAGGRRVESRRFTLGNTWTCFVIDDFGLALDGF
ncbi:hypothetical protein Tco_0877990 [Tanacetum coccineum]|uniref:Uncharacterized protein n=1 Tax=Tanacetum coccineum TaxID=301880 RepID=A0ABQ5C2I6_9ASTR